MKKAVAVSLLVLGMARSSSALTVDSILTNRVLEAYAVAVVPDAVQPTTYYITDSDNHRIVKLVPDTGLFGSLAGFAGRPGAVDAKGPFARFNSPRGIAWLKTAGALVVADYANHTLRLVKTDGTVTTLAGTPGVPGLDTGAVPALQAHFNFPSCVIADPSGNVYIADSKNNAIRRLDAASGLVTTVVSDLHEPGGIALGAGGDLWISDSRDHTIKYLAANTTTPVVVAGTSGQSGWFDSTFAEESLFNKPGGILWLGSAANALLVCDSGNHCIRRIAFDSDIGDYSVETYAGTPTQPGLLDGSALQSKFNGPVGLTSDPDSGYVVADVGNSAIRRIQTFPPLAPISDPVLGYVVFEKDAFGQFVSKLVPITKQTFFNDPILTIKCETGVATHFTYGPTDIDNPIAAPSPTHYDGSAPDPPYSDGIPQGQDVPQIVLKTNISTITIKVQSTEKGRQPSAVVEGQIEFRVATPIIVGDNPASVVVNCSTEKSALWYTIDGSDPTNHAPSIKITGALTLPHASVPITFKVRGFRDNYTPSDPVTKIFNPADFHSNEMTFGFADGEASSEFVASPGQTFLAPVTLSTLEKQAMYTLQFNVIVTNSTPAFSAVDFLDLPTLVQRFVQRSDLFSAYLWTNFFSTNVMAVLSDPSSGRVQLQSTLVDALNGVIDCGASLYSAAAANNVLLSQATTDLQSQNPTGLDLARLNRLVLEDAYPEIARYANRASPAVAAGAVGFQSTLEAKVAENTYVTIPPALYVNGMSPPPSPDGWPGFGSLEVTNPAINLLAVGWLERASKTNLYDSTIQDLITYSMPHDTIFLSANQQVVVGAYSFVVPTQAVPGWDAYQVQLGRPSATSDGIGTDAYIEAPTDGTLSSTPTNRVNAVKAVTVGQRSYVVGDVMPFRWFNAGDFGEGSLLNNDVNEVFQSAVYQLNSPLEGSDFFDAMDSSDGSLNEVYSQDAQIDLIQQGDGKLNVDDVYVTFRRSLDPTLKWYRRYWPSVLFAQGDFSNVPSLVTALNTQADAISSNLWSRFPQTDRQVLANPSASTLDLQTALADGLNDVIQSGALFDPNLFQVQNLSAPTVTLLNTNPSGPDLVRLNRMLLDDTYKNQIYGLSYLPGKRRAYAVPNTFRGAPDQPGQRFSSRASDLAGSTTIPGDPAVSFTADTVQGAPGSEVQVPIRATVVGDYPVRVLMLNVSVQPGESAPALEVPPTFTPSAALGNPTLTDSRQGNNLAAVWLNNAVTGLAGQAMVGYLSLKIPALASSNSVYSVHFAHASASPNGIGLLPEQTQDGLVAVGSAPASSSTDGIPDAWRLLYFGSVTAPQAQANADPDGDGVTNLQEFKAGTNPLDANSLFSVSVQRPPTPAAAAGPVTLHWSSVPNKAYVIETAPALDSPSWTSVGSTIQGTGHEMQFTPTVTDGSAQFYRVRIAE